MQCTLDKGALTLKYIFQNVKWTIIKPMNMINTSINPPFERKKCKTLMELCRGGSSVRMGRHRICAV